MSTSNTDQMFLTRDASIRIVGRQRDRTIASLEHVFKLLIERGHQYINTSEGDARWTPTGENVRITLIRFPVKSDFDPFKGAEWRSVLVKTSNERLVKQLTTLSGKLEKISEKLRDLHNEKMVDFMMDDEELSIRESVDDEPEFNKRDLSKLPTDVNHQHVSQLVRLYQSEYDRIRKIAANSGSGMWDEDYLLVTRGKTQDELDEFWDLVCVPKRTGYLFYAPGFTQLGVERWWIHQSEHSLLHTVRKLINRMKKIAAAIFRRDATAYTTRMRGTTVKDYAQHCYRFKQLMDNNTSRMQEAVDDSINEPEFNKVTSRGSQYSERNKHLDRLQTAFSHVIRSADAMIGKGDDAKVMTSPIQHGYFLQSSWDALTQVHIPNMLGDDGRCVYYVRNDAPDALRKMQAYAKLAIKIQSRYRMILNRQDAPKWDPLSQAMPKLESVEIEFDDDVPRKRPKVHLTAREKNALNDYIAKLTLKLHMCVTALSPVVYRNLKSMNPGTAKYYERVETFTSTFLHVDWLYLYDPDPAKMQKAKKIIDRIKRAYTILHDDITNERESKK